MAKSIVTPTDLREFATVLQKNIEEFTLIENSMNQKLNAYEWRDAVAMKFKADFEATKEPLNKLRLKMEEFMPYLTDKANTLEGEYLETGSGNINFGTAPKLGGIAATGVVGGVATAMNRSTNRNTKFENCVIDKDQWDTWHDNEKLDRLEDCARDITKDLGIDMPKQIETMDMKSFGRYIPNTDTVGINMNLLKMSPPEVLETLTHELRHKWQMEKGTMELKESLKVGTYINPPLKPGDLPKPGQKYGTFEEYYCQLPEMDARQYASDIVTGLYPQYISRNKTPKICSV